MWEHLLKLDKFNVQCKWCHNTYKIDHHTHIEMIIIKEHLYYEKWRKSLKIGKRSLHGDISTKRSYILQNINFCNISLKCLYKPYLRDHLKTHHWKKLQDTIEKEIANYLLHVHFTINIATLTASCYHCNYIVSIFYNNIEIDSLWSHCQYYINEILEMKYKIFYIF